MCACVYVCAWVILALWVSEEAWDNITGCVCVRLCVRVCVRGLLWFASEGGMGRHQDVCMCSCCLCLIMAWDGVCVFVCAFV